MKIAEAEHRKYARCVRYRERFRKCFRRCGWIRAFDNYKRNLKFDGKGIDSYGNRIVELDWIKLIARREGQRSFGNSKQQGYAIKELADNWGFTEIK